VPLAGHGDDVAQLGEGHGGIVCDTAVV